MLFVPRQKGIGKDHFLKLNDKEEVIGIFKGEIHTFKRHWSQNRSLECHGEGCPVCALEPDRYPAFRFRINFITSKGDQWFAKVFEGGGEIYDSLVNLDKKFDLSKTVVEITRRGLKQNTKYDILPLANHVITPDLQAKINSVELIPLTANMEGIS